MSEPAPNTIARADAELGRRLAWLAVALYLAGLGIAAVTRAQADFNSYYLAGARAARAEPLYPPADQSLFLYAPILAIAFAPLAMLPLKAAQGVWFGFNAGAVLAMILGAGALLFGRERRLPASLIVLPALLAARFIDNNIEHGQINLVTFALITWAIVFAEQGHARRAGVMLAIAMLIKPYAILGGLYLGLRRLFSPLRWTAAAAAILVCLPVLLFGPRGALEQTRAYAGAAVSMAGRYRLMLTNQSAVSAIARIIVGRGHAPSADTRGPLLLGMALEAILIALVSLWILHSPGHRAGPPAHERLALCALFCVMPSLAPLSWKSYYAALLVPYMALISTLWIDRPLELDPPATAWLLFILSIVLNLVPGHDLNHLALFYSVHLWSSLSVLGALFAAWRTDENAALGEVEPARL